MSEGCPNPSAVDLLVFVPGKSVVESRTEAAGEA